MNCLRALIRDHRRLALALLVLAFGMKAVIPAGFMVSASADTVLTVTICSDGSSGLETMQLVIPGKDSSHTDGSNTGEHCAFSGLAKAATGGADAILLGLAIAFILVLALAPVRCPPIRQVFYLRPPLRGPPAAA
ncbi:DUF2946 family protein [Parasphingopyxis sp.]|uniref:DUF2946 family protein n=1 Tax=Parasphingopyxis sp. TaxID=1920299 RepID=UPI002631B5DD|nr:DUF2946 family protein [Parasphingopyxis sp.]